MDWIVGAFIAIGVLLAVKIFLSSQAPGRNRRREDLAHVVRSLLILRENGGSLHVRHRGSDLAFDFVRAEGGDDDALLVLRVPRASWSKEHGAKLRDLFKSHLFDVRLVEDSESETLAEVRIPVENIWEESCGARGARAAHLLLDALAVPQEAGFDLKMHGAGNARGLRRELQLRRQRRI